MFKYGNFTRSNPDGINLCSSMPAKLCDYPNEGLDESFLNN